VAAIERKNMKTLVTILFCTLATSAFADVDGPVENYTMTTPTSEPVDVLSELDDDPEQVATATSTEVTTVTNNRSATATAIKQEWNARNSGAVKRKQADPTLR
jgi:hypothetical protein